jgi:serine/threonine protein kinase
MQSDHPNIVKLYAYIEDNKTINMVMEYVSQGNLFKHLKESPNKKFSEEKVAIFFKDIISAFEYLHSKNPPILHR